MASISIRQPYSGPRRRLVLAIDLRTTFSTVSYAILHPGRIPEIKTVMRYPGQESGDMAIPTVIYYNAAGEVLAVGAEEPAMCGDDEDSDWEKTTAPIKVEWFKLLLRPSTNDPIQGIPGPTIPVSKDIVAVYADFYAYIFDWVRGYITQTHANGALSWKSVEDDIVIVLNHPDGWGTPQQSVMRRAAVMAGLVPDTRDGHGRIKGALDEPLKPRDMATTIDSSDVMQRATFLTLALYPARERVNRLISDHGKTGHIIRQLL